jgi:hypothetical protein
VKTSEKSNEIDAIPRLLLALDLSGCVITIDAMKCQKQITRDTIRGKGDYVLALKENRPKLRLKSTGIFFPALPIPLNLPIQSEVIGELKASFTGHWMSYFGKIMPAIAKTIPRLIWQC